MKVAQPCPTLCDPVDYTVSEILQARILEWLAFLLSRGSSQPRDRTQVSCIVGRFFTSWTTREALVDHVQFTLIHWPNILKTYAVFTASKFTFTNRHIYSGASCPLWSSLFILSGTVSPLLRSSILDTYWPGGLIIRCYVFLPFHTIHGVLRARILKWFAVPFSSEPCLSKLSTMTRLSKIY